MSNAKYTSDALVFAGKNKNPELLKILLIKRGNPPFKDKFALPGGFIDPGETPFQASLRELEEETNLKKENITSKGIPLSIRQLPGRDPRGPTITHPFTFWVSKKLKVSGGDDAASANWYTLSDVDEFAFDHGAIICEALGLWWKNMSTENSDLIKKSEFCLNSFENLDEIIFYGGSFNPWHEGHQACIEQLSKRLNERQQLVVIPDYNPQKPGKNMPTGFRDALSFYKFITKKCKNFANTKVFPGFIGKEKTNPTAYWLKDVKKKNPNKLLSLLMGFDSLANIQSWIDAKELLNNLNTIYAVPRDTNQDNIMKSQKYIQENHQHLKIEILENHPFEKVSSTEIRNKK